MESRLIASWLVLALLSLSGGTLAQTMTTNSSSVDANNLLSTTTALYILIGIAALYFSITLLCLLLVVCTCYTNHKQGVRRAANNYEYKELRGTSPPVSPFDAIPEKQVTSDIGSQESSVSLFTTDDEDCEFAETRTQVSRLSTIFTNKAAFTAENETNLQKHGNSGLANYTPKMSPTPHSDIKVPFTQTEPSRPSHHQPSHSHTSHLHPARRGSPLNRVPDMREKSPRFKRRTQFPLKQDERVQQTVGRGQLESPVVRRVKSDSPVNQGKPDQKSTQKSRIRSDDKPQTPSTPFKNRKTPKSEHLCTSTEGSYNRKKSVPHSSIPSYYPPDPPLAKEKKTSKTVHRDIQQITLVKLIFELKPASSKWRSIGTQLKVSSNVLDTIAVSVRRKDASLARVCEEWMKDADAASWSEVVRALKSVSEKDLAISIHQRYCSGHLDFSDDDKSSAEDDDDDMNTVSWID